MTDPIADMLTRLRNAARARKTEFTVPYSKLKSEIARILEKEGYIAGFELETPEKGHPNLKIKNKFVNKACAIAGLKRVSRPGLRRYVGAGEVPRVLGGMGIAMLSTSQGVLTGREAQETKRRRGAPRLHLVRETVHVTNRQKTHRGTRQGEGECRRAKARSPSKARKASSPGTFRQPSAPAWRGASSLSIATADTRQVKALHGLSRALIANMVAGVNEGFKKELEIQGVGFKAAVQGQKLNLSLGKSHPILFQIPASVKITVAENTKIKIEGIDKHLVGQIAADIRAFYPPEPYKGKGVRYAGEQVRRKEGKTVQ